MKTIDLNCDMGESYGAWKMGADADVMPFITSANIACGFHGGDPATIRKTVRLAVLHRGEQTRSHDPQAHFSFSNSFLEIAKKRTRSPGANRLAGSRAGSNTVSGVRPMMFQPPGVS